MKEKEVSFDRCREFSGKTIEEAMEALSQAMQYGELACLPGHVVITVKGNQLSPEAQEFLASKPV